MTSPVRGMMISVMLAIEDTPTAVQWYKRALGATELWSLRSVAGMELEGASFFLGLVLRSTSSENESELTPHSKRL